MPVTSDTRNRIVAVPARIQGYNTLDKKIKGLGLRVTPYGRKIWFLQVMHQGKRHYRTLGDMPVMSEIAARQVARDLLVQIKVDGVVKPAIGSDKNFAHVAEEVFRRHGQRWKPLLILMVTRFCLHLHYIPDGRVVGLHRLLLLHYFHCHHSGQPDLDHKSHPCVLHLCYLRR